jgi:hypothetical protein
MPKLADGQHLKNKTKTLDVILRGKMTNAQKPNKHRRNKSNHKSTTRGARAHQRLNHGKGKRGNISRKTKK